MPQILNTPSEEEMRETLYAISEATVGLEIIRGDSPVGRFSGVHIGNGKIVTAHHGVKELQDDDILVVNTQDRKSKHSSYRGKIDEIIPGVDAAFIKIKDYQSGLKSVSIGESVSVKTGEKLTYIPYYPQRRIKPCVVLDYKIKAGDLEERSRLLYPDMVPYLFPVGLKYAENKELFGNSGGGVFNSLGKLCGIVHGGAESFNTLTRFRPAFAFILSSNILRRS